MPDPSKRWKEQSRALFDFESEYYAQERESSPSFCAQLSIVLRALDGQQGRILDIGCAAGGEIPALRAHGFEVIGVDYAPQMIEYARGRFGADSAVHFSRADAEQLPFSAEAFDHVVCLGVLEYLPSYQASLAEISRVLRPGGVAVFSIPSRVSPHHVASILAFNAAGPLWRLAKRLLGRGGATAVPRVPEHRRNLCVPGQFRMALRRHGFDIEMSAHSNFTVFPLDRLWPAGNLRIAAALERYSRSVLVGWIGAQYLVSARKRSGQTPSPPR
jgi:SAM-dependent methyltransferase